MEYSKLFNWYHQNKRELPFRKTDDPYKIWVSEIMLQQTQVETMLPYYETFLNKYPDVKSLSDADLEEVLHTVAGIGYYKRFRMLKKGAEFVFNQLDGVLPVSYEELLKIPGIGMYTAGAIASIAYNLAYPATDGNVIRVLSRVYGLKDDYRLDKNKKQLNIFNKKLIESSNNPHDYTQSMMELGATVCRPVQPKCDMCPLKEICVAYQTDSTDQYPVMSKLKKQKEISYFSFILKKDNQYVLRKRNQDLLNGFYEFVQVEAESLNAALNKLDDLGFVLSITKPLNSVKHVFTHLIWHIEVYEGIAHKVPAGFEFYSELHSMPMATVHKKIRNQII